MRLEFSAGGIVYQKKNKEVLFALILNSFDQWTFPKGHIEKKEKPENAALREVTEEIGIEALTVKQLLDKIDYWFKFDEDLIHKFVYFYLMETPPDSKLIPQEEEIKKAQWFTVEKALENLKYKEDIKTFEKALEALKIAKS